MQFTYELENNNVCFRARRDFSFRNLEGRLNLTSEDLILDSPTEIEHIRHKDKRVICGVEYSIVGSGVAQIEEHMLAPSCRVFYDDFPPMPSKENLVKVIRGGNDSVDNSLVVNIKGHFELRNLRDVQTSMIDPTVIVWRKVFRANNGHVGLNATKDTAALEMTYLQMSTTWLVHLWSGKTQLQCTERQIGEEEFKQDLLNAWEKWRPGYEWVLICR